VVAIAGLQVCRGYQSLGLGYINKKCHSQWPIITRRAVLRYAMHRHSIPNITNGSEA
jgi:hypothetical protein